MTAFGSFGSDPLDRALDDMVNRGLELARELGIGFEANQSYDAVFFREMYVQRQIFTLTSVKSGTAYSFLVRLNVPLADVTTTVQVIHVMTEGRAIPLKHYRMLTLSQGEGGRIIARSGWRE